MKKKTAGEKRAGGIETCMKLWESCPLFEGFSPADIPLLLRCLGVFKRSYEKGECILDVEQELVSVCVFLEGTAHVHQESDFGGRNLVMELGAGEVFGEAALCAGYHKSHFRIVAATQCEVMYIHMDRILHPNAPICPFRNRLVENLLKRVSKKNVDLGEKLDIVSRRSLRERVRIYLSRQARLNGSSKFDISFSRQDLADYLNVDRSALSRELCRMKEEGLIEFAKNSFSLAEAFPSGIDAT